MGSTLNEPLRRVMEPRTSTTAKRLEAVEALAHAGVPVSVLTAPIIPGLTDHEIPALVEAAAKAGARSVGYNIVHLPYGTKELFTDFLARHAPERQDKVLNRLRAMRGGRLNDPRFGQRMTGEGLFAEQIAAFFRTVCRRAGLPKARTPLSTAAFRVPGMVQPELFD